MTYELIIKANTKEELIALLEGAAVTDVAAKEKAAVESITPPMAPSQQAAPISQVTPQAPTVSQVTAPTKPSYTVDDLVRAAAPLMDDPEGVRMLQELLASFGAASLVELDKNTLVEFADGLRSLGVEV